MSDLAPIPRSEHQIICEQGLEPLNRALDGIGANRERHISIVVLSLLLSLPREKRMDELKYLTALVRESLN
jgi:hypothetical protein